MKTILILMDSLNRHYLPAYGGTTAMTPSIDRLSREGATFDRHYCASMPCMPARRDLMNGRYNFLETPWGPLEPYDECLPKALRAQGKVYSHMITDHYHYWEWFGMGYNNFYNTWEFMRGQEGDHWHPRVKDPEVPPYRGKNRRQDWINRTLMDTQNEEEYPTPQCFRQAIDFLEHNHDQDNWFLHLETFDPHEPFMCPKKYYDIAGDTWNGGYLYDWPNYAPLDPEKDDPATVEHVRRCYAATLLMGDTWLGKLLSTMDRFDLWKDTAVILTTDHGHLLGEHGYWAKNYMFDYEELTHIPLIMAGKGIATGERRRALTSTVDLMPTVMDLHGCRPGEYAHGRSLRPLFTADTAHHDGVLFGYFAKDINYTDGRYTYCRQPREGSVTHHHTAMPVNAIIEKHRTLWAGAECGKFLKQSFMPVYRTPIPSYRRQNAPAGTPVFYLSIDPAQTSPVDNKELERELAGSMRDLLARCGAPLCQFERTGLDSPA